MRLKVDENLHDEVAELLRQAGHDAETVHAEGLRGSNDAALAQHCQAEQRAILTLDLDFADIRAFPPASSAGLIVVRVHDQSRSRIRDVISRALDVFRTETIEGRLWIVSESGVRIRGS